MRTWMFGVWLGLAACGLAVACTSAPVDDEPGSAGSASVAGSAQGGGAGAGGSSVIPSACSSALRQALGLVDEVSTATVTPLETGAELVMFVDATAGGLGAQDNFPWVYVSLATGTAVALSDLEALKSSAWDLAFKRFIVRTNSGDSGPGQGGALRVGLPWESVDASTQGSRMLLTESWFDADCKLTTDDQGQLLTTFSGWSEYDTATHVLSPADAVYLTQGGDGTKYKVAIVDYYSNPDGSPGKTPGRYKLRVAALP